MAVTEPGRPRVDLVQRVVFAWLDSGPRPDVHAAAQERLRDEWPTLANAVQALSAWWCAVDPEAR